MKFLTYGVAELRGSVITLLVLMLIVLLVPWPVEGQSNSSGENVDPVCPVADFAAFHACAVAVAAAESATPPRTVEGRPDFSGVWRRRTWAFEDFEAHPVTPDDFGGPSVVVDPTDGKVPLQLWAVAQSKINFEKYIHHNAVCTLSGPAGTMYMTSRLQFSQDEQNFVMIGEQLTAHPWRIVPLDGRPHIGNIPLWNGDPRGHWEGDTLVIESPNQNAKYMLDQKGRFVTEEANIVETMTLVDPNTIHYTATFDDPLVYTQAFTIAFAFRRMNEENPEVWEESCYETNADAMRLFRNTGRRVFPGVSANEARELKAAWEASQQ
ncbi:MAG: hypothetical protein HOM55_09350 [Proteobacteria bacterium]|jgi:hypothetical protein|nr:hypothetical protein [Pseudomonadota bacterium]